MKRLSGFGLGALAVSLLLGGCDVKSSTQAEYDPAASFAGLKTYRWLEDSGRATADRQVATAEVRTMVVQAIDKALAEKGFALAAAGAKADFLVGYHVGLNGRPDMRSMNAYYNYPPGWAWDHYRFGRDLYPKDPEQPTMVLENYGSLVVDVAAPADGRLVWRGTVSTYIPQHREAAKHDQDWFDSRAREAVHEFPPAP
jgi:hypothetical protein